MANYNEVNPDRPSIKLRQKVRSIYTQREGTVIQINGNGFTAAVKWDDGELALAPIAALLKVGGKEASDCLPYRTDNKNPYKNMVSSIKQKQSSKFRKEMMDADDKNDYHIVYAQYKSIDDFTADTLTK